MSYQIRYGTSFKKQETIVHKSKTRFLVLVLVLAIAITLLFPANFRSFRRHLFPFLEPRVTAAASDMLERMEEGTPVSEAFHGFCHDLLVEKISAD